MNKKSSFSRIDEQVFFAMGGLVLIALIVLSFRVATRTTCTPVVISAGEGPHIAGITVTIKGTSTGGSSFTWDFGDGSPSWDGTATATHIYKKSGKYTITLMTNGSCTGFYDLYVKEMPVRLNLPSEVGFTGQETAFVNQLITFTDTAARHTAWEWHEDESAPVSGYEKSFSFKYTSEGVKKVWVKVNNKDVLYKYVQVFEDPKITEEKNKARLNRNTGDRHVVVGKKDPDVPPLPVPDPKPDPRPEPPPAPEKPKFPEVNGTEMGNYLLEYADDKKEEGFFGKYFCGPVSVEYDSKFYSFPAFLAKLKDMRRIKSISVELTKDENSCVKKMSVKIKKRFL